MAHTSVALELGETLEFWAQGPGRMVIVIEGEVVWQVPALAAVPAAYRYHHREAAEVVEVSPC